MSPDVIGRARKALETAADATNNADVADDLRRLADELGAADGSHCYGCGNDDGPSWCAGVGRGYLERTD